MEDNEFNQELAVNLLKKWGHVAVLAGDGKAALAAWEREPFDLILMDVQMPDMDGFAVTEAIRAKERATNTHVPIVALTAHAMKGDRERCLAAGMDAYASKPIRAAELFEVIARLLPSDGEGAKGTPGPEGPPGAVFDLDTALAVVDGDRELLRRMVQCVPRPVPEAAGGDPRFGPARGRRRPGAGGAQVKGFGGQLRCAKSLPGSPAAGGAGGRRGCDRLEKGVS